MNNTTEEELPAKQLGAIWFVLFIVEFTSIFLINACTLVAFARNRQLRKRTTYLIINLTVADLLVGVVTGPLEIYYPWMEPKLGFTWKEFGILIVYDIFPILSLSTLSLISLERLHATLYPFRHCLIEERVYLKIITGCWLFSFLFASVDSALYNLWKPISSYYLWTSFIVLILLILVVSCVIIAVKVKTNPLSLSFRLVVSDRKLSVTLFIVAFVSILTILPWAVYTASPDGLWIQLTNWRQSNIYHAVVFLYYTNSTINPLIYALRMQEFRKAVRKLFRKTLVSTSDQPIGLHGM